MSKTFRVMNSNRQGGFMSTIIQILCKQRCR
uniref:Uncharacterized protein n=1 Tax=Anguilla anguilla TaxID=7936 RepID=A0A0E9QFR4_ANGAN